MINANAFETNTKATDTKGGRTMEFSNLRAEMARAGFDIKTMAKLIDIGQVAYGNKINGKSEWRKNEMVAVQKIINDKLGTSYPLDYLFKE